MTSHSRKASRIALWSVCAGLLVHSGCDSTSRLPDPTQKRDTQQAREIETTPKQLEPLSPQIFIEAVLENARSVPMDCPGPYLDEIPETSRNTIICGTVGDDSLEDVDINYLRTTMDKTIEAFLSQGYSVEPRKPWAAKFEGQERFLEIYDYSVMVEGIEVHLQWKSASVIAKHKDMVFWFAH